MATQAEPSPALKAPIRQRPAETAAIRSPAVSMPTSTPSATWMAAGQSAPPPFSSQSITASSVARSAEPAAGGTASVSDCTRGGRSGLSLICTWTVTPLPREPPAAVAGVMGTGLPAGIVAELPDTLADQGDPPPSLRERGVHGHVRREQPLRGGDLSTGTAG